MTRYSFAVLRPAERGERSTAITSRQMRAQALEAGLRADALGSPVETLTDLVAAPETRGWQPGDLLLAIADLYADGTLQLARRRDGAINVHLVERRS